jgi:membrane protease subunit HflK
MAFKWNKYQGGQQPSLEGSLEEIRQKFQRFKGDYSLKTFVIILVLGFAAWTSWFTVQPEETGVVQRFGEVIRTADPGLRSCYPGSEDTVRRRPLPRGRIADADW